MKSKKTMKILLAVALLLVAILVFYFWGKDHIVLGRNGGTSLSSMVETYTKNKADMKLTIGVLKGDKTSYKVFGEDARVLEPVEYEYEIGSLSKTFTASMLCKAVSENRITLEDSIAKYLPLDAGAFYPTVLSLATHTSGYGEYPFDEETLSEKELKAIDQKFSEERLNIYQGINRADIIDLAKKHPLKSETYDWEYSNFGFALLGTVLGEAYESSFKAVAEDFIRTDLGLTKTRLGNGTGNLKNYWNWNEDDTYYAAGGVVSTVSDLLEYSRLHLDDTPDYLSLSHKTYQTFEKEGFAMGLGWIIDPETGYLWHNGGTSSYTSFLGFDKEHDTAVVILSNYPAKDGGKEEDALDVLGYTLLETISGDGDTLELFQ